MRTEATLIGLGIVAAASTAHAEAPKVVTDIPPVHSLVATVMGDVGSPNLIVPPGVSPHGFSMKPSEAELLEEADAVFWIGEGLTPWLERAVDSLAGDATSIELMEAEGIALLDFREGATFEGHDHDHGDHGDEHAEHDDHDHEEHADHDDHDHDEHDHEEHAEHDDDHEEHAEKEEHADHDHDHEEHAEHDDDHDHEEHAEKDDHGHDDHDHEEHADHDDHGHDEHGHGENDPHVWLDPVNAQAMLTAIADTLASIDPANADQYQANAAAGRDALDALIAEVDEQVHVVHDKRFVVFHDAYHYFESRFDVEATGSISLPDATDPSASRVAEVQDTVRDLGVQCVFREPQFPPNLTEVVVEGTDARTGVLDPLGTDLETGPGLYAALIRNIASGLTGCLDESS
ncbi:MAG: zinc ABC transporter substrate-binding protein [Pseudomonadota bacterium]